jgi:bacillithiol system protein YtxJ
MSFQSSSGSNGFVELLDTDSLDRFLAQSNGSPAIIFKHSNSCGISARAHEQMSKIERPVGLVIVQKARALSDEIAKRTGIAHETPQAFILRDREVLWTASHGQIKAEAVEAALLEISEQWAVAHCKISLQSDE